MTELDAGLVRRKLAVIKRNLDDLQPIEGMALAAYQADRFRQKGTERLLQEAIEAAVDVNLHVLRALGVATPGDYYESFVAVGRHGVIPPELAAALAAGAGLRNRLVHEYDAIDDAIVLDAVRTARERLGAFIAAVEAHLQR